MKLVRLAKILEETQKEFSDAFFHEFILRMREAIGIKQNYAAIFCGIKKWRFKDLELGYFSDPISLPELEALSELYGIEIEILKQKMEEFLDWKYVQKKGKHENREAM